MTVLFFGGNKVKEERAMESLRKGKQETSQKHELEKAPSLHALLRINV